jgi:hypothetical protein
MLPGFAPKLELASITAVVRNYDILNECLDMARNLWFSNMRRTQLKY